MTRVNSVDDHNGGDIGPQEITMKRRYKQYRGIWVGMMEAVEKAFVIVEGVERRMEGGGCMYVIDKRNQDHNMTPQRAKGRTGENNTSTTSLTQPQEGRRQMNLNAQRPGGRTNSCRQVGQMDE